MPIKTLIIAHTGLSKPTTFTDIKATTLDELRKEVPQIDLSDKYNIVERESKTTLSSGESKLPNADNVVLFVSQKQIKAGASAEDMSRVELMKVAKEARETPEGVSFFGNYSNTTTVDLRKQVAEWQSRTNGNPEVGDVRQMILSKLDELKEFVKNSDLAEPSATTPQATFEDLFLEKIDQEFKSMKK